MTDPPEQIQSSFGFGSCRSGISGPVHLAPALDDVAFFSTWRVIYACSSGILAETLVGVGNFFNFPPPGNTSSGPAPIVRGASDVAAVWRNLAIPTLSPPTVIPSLAASFVAPGTPTMITLASAAPTVAPALAAIGDTFFAFHASGNQLHVIRFSRAGGVLDPSGGIAVTTTANPISQLVAAGDGTSAIVAWLESDGTVRAPNPRLLSVLTKVSDHFGGRRIVVISGFRPPVGYTRETSRHTRGDAIDLRIDGVPVTAIRDYCRTLPDLGCGYYPRSQFVHVDVRDRAAYWIDWSGPGEAPQYRRPANATEDATGADEASAADEGGEAEGAVVGAPDGAPSP